MLKVLLVISVLLSALQAQHTEPISGFGASQCTDSLFYADEHNLCWYYICVRGEGDQFTLQPMQCPEGTRLPDSYFADFLSPCSVIYEGDYNWECTREREIDLSEPACSSELQCSNGGLLRYGHGTCWCDCPRNWRGDPFCKTRTGEDPHIVPQDLCPDSTNFCDAVGGCLNGGECFNLCGGYWCNCPVPFRYGRRCESFDCTGTDECYNGGTCDRGVEGNREYRLCKCPIGFTGRQCEIKI